MGHVSIQDIRDVDADIDLDMAAYLTSEFQLQRHFALLPAERQMHVTSSFNAPALLVNITTKTCAAFPHSK
jgi:hypothetical protein